MPFSGGKFIANCLALSRDVLSLKKELAQQDLLFTTYNQTYYDFKLQSALDSIPCNTTWTEYCGPGNWWHNVNGRGKHLCHILHTDDYDSHKKQHKDSIVIKLTHYDKFATLAYALKKGNDPTWKSLAKFQLGFDHWYRYSQPGDYELPIDFIMYHPDNFLTKMKELYSFLELDDFDNDRLYRFYERYRKWHDLA